MTSINGVVSSILNDYYSAKNAVNSTSKASTASTTSTTSTTTTTNTTTTSTTGYTNETSLGRYLTTVNSSDADAQTIFQKLSIDLGGDGKTISQEQLNSYISNAESGKIDIPDKELNALKSMQSDWKDISNGSDKISYSDMVSAGDKSILTSMAPAKADTPDYMQIANDATHAAYQEVVDSALSFSPSSNSASTLESTLKTLLSGSTDENDDSNADAISKIINIMANSKKTSTFETEV